MADKSTSRVRQLGRRAKGFVMRGWGRTDLKTEVKRGLFHASIGLVGWLLIQPFYLSKLWLSVFFLLVGSFFWQVDRLGRLVEAWQSHSWYARLLKWMKHNWLDTRKREIEANQDTTIRDSILGFVGAWLVLVPVSALLQSDLRWIVAYSLLLFALVDPLSKLGRIERLAIYRFQSGAPAGKSVGGMLWGLLGGGLGAWLIFWWQATYGPMLFTPDIGVGYAVGLYAIGLVAAVLGELFGGKLDNLFIPAGSAWAMALVHTMAIAYSTSQGG